MNANPVRIACQENSESADSAEVPQISSQHKMVWIGEYPQITGFLRVEMPVSLSQTQFGALGPDRRLISHSCQTQFEDVDNTAVQNDGLAGEDNGHNRQENPVRVEVAR